MSDYIPMPFDWQPREPDAERARGYVRAGFWNDETLGGILATGLRAVPDHAFTVRSERRPFRGTFRDVDALACRVAAGLRARGIGPGDAVAFQLPNWVDAAATFYAIAYLGAMVVPIVHFYGAKEVGYILRRTRVKALVTTDRFGHQDFLANLDAIRAAGDIDGLEWVSVVGAPSRATAAGGTFPFADLLEHGAIDAPVPVDPMAPALIAYTSGTTADPKGVVHVHRTINAEIRQLSAMQSNRGVPDNDPNAIDMLTGAPVGHGIGMLAALLTPVFRRRN
ncbi:MAG: acyl-CoA synthetase, partial [Actinomycetota bacterium]|nr:acyl-CoA synthetase [Actinomycetota bacterium]